MGGTAAGCVIRIQMAASSAQITALLAAKAAVDELQQWHSALLSYSVSVDHVAVDITTDRLRFHLKCELAQPLPPAYAAHAEFLCLDYPLGGLWQIHKASADGRSLTCVAWKTTELKRDEVAAVATELVPSDDPAKEQVQIFSWMMQLGVWEQHNHWFARAVDIPASRADVKRPTATLLAGFAPLEAVLHVNRISSVDTVAQTFSADVTWEVTLRGVTTIRKDSVLHELLGLLEFDQTAFEFTNVSEIVSEKDLSSKFLPAGRVQFGNGKSKGLHHLQYSKRLSAVFSEEMTLYFFPFDHQKITFAFDMTEGLQPFMPIAAAAKDPGTFAVQSFKLGNIFNVVYGDKVFVGAVVDTATEKSIRFELMLERQSGYYLTNVALPAMIITYLCFTSYAPLADGSLLDTSSRLQIVTTLLLTIITFKSNLSAIIPQVSYFTSIDKYVFFCFVITCVVTVENSLYPVIVEHLPNPSWWDERWLLWFSIGWFSVVNSIWALNMLVWVKMRAYRSKTLLRVHEYVRMLAETVPREHREAVLRAYLQQQKVRPWALPAISTTKSGNVFVQLPSDALNKAAKKAIKTAKRSSGHEQELEHDRSGLQQLYRAMTPTAVASSSSKMLNDMSSVSVHIGTNDGSESTKMN